MKFTPAARDAHAHLTRAGRARIALAQLEHLGATDLLDDDRLHGPTVYASSSIAACPPAGIADLRIAAALVVGTLAAYWRIWGNGFVALDDPEYVAHNPVVLAGFTWQGIAWAFSTNATPRTGTRSPGSRSCSTPALRRGAAGYLATNLSCT